MDEKNNGSFWPSYVDVMTTLFAITLVLFAVSFSRFKIKEEQLQSLVDEYENIITVYSAVGTIDSTRYFTYNNQYLKHLITIEVEYQEKQYRMDMLNLDITNKDSANAIREDIINAGNVVKKAIENIENSDTVKNNIKFLVVIEGQSSKLTFKNANDWMNNYTLSYLRAQYLNEFWKEHGINLDSIPKCELIICGSGETGVPRVHPNINSLELRYGKNTKEFWYNWASEEKKNQRFLVHIVPVIGNIDVTKEKIDQLKGKK